MFSLGIEILIFHIEKTALKTVIYDKSTLSQILKVSSGGLKFTLYFYSCGENKDRYALHKICSSIFWCLEIFYIPSKSIHTSLKCHYFNKNYKLIKYL